MKNVVFQTTTARHGHLRTPSALRRFLKKKSWSPAVATAEQVHKAHVVCVPKLAQAKEYRGADGLLTDQSEQPLGIFTADCVPIFLKVPAYGIIGVLHAGWRGAQQNILKKAVRLLRQRWKAKPQDVQLVLGPSIGSCCFEVGWDVAKYFPNSRSRRKARWTVDLADVIRRQGLQMGIPARQIQSQTACTHHNRTFFSYRRDQTMKRQVSLIMKVKGN